jgi:hypothetical protein
MAQRRRVAQSVQDDKEISGRIQEATDAGNIPLMHSLEAERWDRRAERETDQSMRNRYVAWADQARGHAVTLNNDKALAADALEKRYAMLDALTALKQDYSSPEAQQKFSEALDGLWKNPTTAQ